MQNEEPTNDDQVMKTESVDQEQGEEREDVDADTMLQLLSHLANFYGIGFPVSLNVGGLLISGIIMSRDEYMKTLSNHIRATLSQTSDEVKEFMEDILTPLTQPPGEDEKEPPFTQTAYIHLRDARVFNTGGNPIPAGDGFLWRGRLTSIDGFSWGLLSASRQ